ncbi:YifB family Mg chelatase-like AAA ATPase [Arsenicicoccus piscis]|uniref:MCM C-terminal AAA(+) ATPase domain-containing protein n=1 Tax=Arsenicicoccus piscis TaxID=673954 RepID=A0ABQ6HLY5_9MICO|nr:YifB family Mg chelatase-like AAA ATPase [Arsenicicoccus piscis]MCH8626979.1 YifB family Mg chelatase-like AAA ATPase [Arsenicicoccus piscis]GMA19098.1 hypothetical protein GCM10025862_11190 [Arsenicicoccus piscis]
MGVATTRAVALLGLDPVVVDVEADIADGLPSFTITGMPDSSVGEAKERLRAAAANSDCPIPRRRLTVNLSPAWVPKRGPGFDLAMTVALLRASGQIPVPVVDVVHLGELSLTGRIIAVKGVLPCVRAAADAGVRRVFVPEVNVAEARLVPGIEVIGVRSLRGLVAHYRGESVEEPDDTEEAAEQGQAGGLPTGAAGAAVGDLSEIVGQHGARFAIEVAAAGGHHLFLVGPPGAGKTMLAERLPGILPVLPERDALEVTAIASVLGRLDQDHALVTRPPFIPVHHGASMAAMVGGGRSFPQPGAITAAHRGVLFLDETPEFAPSVLNALREPMEGGTIRVDRAQGSAVFPARFQLVAAANPCPCGKNTGKGLDCTCSVTARRGYLSRVSGPVLDRIDIQVSVPAVTKAELGGPPGEPSALVAARVRAARERQRVRLAEFGKDRNAEVGSKELLGPLRPEPAATADLDRLMERDPLSVRGYLRALRLAWTVADLSGHDRPDQDDVALALSLRTGLAA